MWDFKFSKAIGLMGQTMPYLLFRLGIYMLMTLIYIAVTGGGAGIGYIAGKIGGDPAAGTTYGGLIGFGIVSAAIYFFREYLLYQVKAGHIAVLVEKLDGKELPEGKGQVEYGKDMVVKHFKESSVLFAVDQLIKGILKAFNRVFFGVASLIPIPGLDQAAKFIGSVVRMSMTYLDEVILAYHMRTRGDNAWSSAKDATILYAQNYKSFFKNAFFLTIFMWLLTILVFIVVLAPIGALVALFPALAGFWTFAFAFVLVWGIKAAVLDPIAMTCLMQVFFKVTEGQEPNPEWDAKLEKVSGKFKELKQKAAEKWSGGDKSEPEKA